MSLVQWRAIIWWPGGLSSASKKDMTLLLSKTSPSIWTFQATHNLTPADLSRLPSHSSFCFLCALLLILWFHYYQQRIHSCGSFFLEYPLNPPHSTFQYLHLFNSYFLTKPLWIWTMLSNLRCICGQRNIVQKQNIFSKLPKFFTYTTNPDTVIFFQQITIGNQLVNPCANFPSPRCHSSDLSKHKFPLPSFSTLSLITHLH